MWRSWVVSAVVLVLTSLVAAGPYRRLPAPNDIPAFQAGNPFLGYPPEFFSVPRYDGYWRGTPYSAGSPYGGYNAAKHRQDESVGLGYRNSPYVSTASQMAGLNNGATYMNNAADTSGSELTAPPQGYQNLNIAPQFSAGSNSDISNVQQMGQLQGDQRFSEQPNLFDTQRFNHDTQTSYSETRPLTGSSEFQSPDILQLATEDANGHIKKVNVTLPHSAMAAAKQGDYLTDNPPNMKERFDDVRVTDSVGEIVGKVISREFKGDCQVKGFQFDGGHVKFPSNKMNPAPTGSFTFVTWLRVRSLNRINVIYSTSAPDGARHFLEVRESEKKKPLGFVRWMIRLSKGTNLFTIATDDVVPAGIWTHLVAKYDAKQGRAYIFINAQKTLKTKDVPKTSKLAWGPDVILGGAVAEDGKSSAGSYIGSLLKIRFVEKPLSDPEIEAVYQECTPKNGGIPYLITTCSGDTKGSPTSSTVYIQLIGEDGQFGEFKVGTGFKKGCSKSVTFNGPQIGALTSIVVRKGTDGMLQKDWKMEKIVVIVGDPDEGKETGAYTFPCNPLCKFAEKGNTLTQAIAAKPRVNGGWSEWSQWSGCGSGMCGGDKKVKTRSCTNPLPSEGGKKCTLPDGTPALLEAMEEPCKVDGGWSSWTPWSECAEVCGGSVVERSRACDNPAPANGGATCPGPDKETKNDCTEPCEDWPVDGGWSEWEAWSPCSQTCGGAPVTRMRTCNNPEPKRGGLPCEGDNTETATDCTNPCPIDGGWTEWTEWSMCSTSCGPGQQSRDRNCTNPPPAYGGKPCEGNPTETQPCKLTACPNAVNGNWGDWGPYSECTEKEICLQGTRSRKRECNNPPTSGGGDECPGLDTEEDICPKENCKPAKGESIPVKPQTFLSDSCKATTAFFAGGEKASEIPDSIYTSHLKDISDDLKTSYFVKMTRKANFEEITKYCFQPSTPLTIDKVQKAFPGYSAAPSLPKFDKPAGSKETPGVSIELKPDGSLFSGEFSLGDSKSYAPLKDVKVNNARFVFREEPGSRGVLAYGQQDLVNSVFDVQVTAGPSIKGSSASTTDAATIMKALAFPAVSSATGAETSAKDMFINWVIDYLSELALAKIPISGLSEATTEATKRISGSVAIGEKDMFYVEVIKQKSFAIGFTSDQAAFGNFMELVMSKVKRKPTSVKLFGEMRDVTIGIAYAHAAFKVEAATKFTREPLKSGFSKSIKKGVFMAVRMRLPETCQSDVCKVMQGILGKDNFLMLTGNANPEGFEIRASVTKETTKENADKIKLSNLEFFIQVKLTKLAVGISFSVDVPVEGEIMKDNIVQPKSVLVLKGTAQLSNALSIGATLKMEGIWRKAFGVSFLSIGDLGAGLELTPAGIPTKIEFSGTIILGKDCMYPEDFTLKGNCLKGIVNVNVSPNIIEQYVYGSISAVTVGKVFRMLGSKLELPDRIAQTGFEKDIVVSFAGKEHTIPFAGKTVTVKKGLYVSGRVNLLGVAADLTIELSTDIIYVNTVLSPIKLPGGITLTQSIKDTKTGPRFYAKATRNPLTIEIFLQGALKIFGVETEIKFLLKPTFIEATLNLKLPIPSKLGVEVYIKGGYGSSKDEKDKKGIGEIEFTARVTVTTEKKLIEQDTGKDLNAGIESARAKLQAAKDKLKEEKENCEKRVVSHCAMCEEIACKQITDSCNSAMDSFNNFIGGAANRFGGWAVGKAKKIADKFKSKAERRKRSIEHFYGRPDMMAHFRGKRFVGKYMCKKLAPALCKGAKLACEASCELKSHITKGICKALDLAHKSLYLIEEGFYWVKKAHSIIPKDIFILHNLCFQATLSSSLKTGVGASVDVTVMKVRRKFTLEANLEDLKKLAKSIMDKALSEFKKMFRPKFSKPKYDKPGTKADYLISAPFRIQNAGSQMCIQSPGPNAGSPLAVAGCAGDATLWVYTLTGELMNIENGLCLTVEGAAPALKIVQQPCKGLSTAQKISCNWNRIFVPQTDNCLVESVSAVKVEKCETQKDDEEVVEPPKTQQWLVAGDPRKKVCDNFVVDLAVNKPATQSSDLAAKDIDEDSPLKPEEKQKILAAVGAAQAVDGNMAASLVEGSCAHTGLQMDPWWKVDLQAEYIITDVSLQTPTEGSLIEALSNFEIRVGMSAEFKTNPMCGARVISTHVGELWTSQCTPPLPGQYVSVQMYGNVFLSLCEVAVFARKDNHGKCSDELRRKRSLITSYKDLVLKRATVTYGRYE